MALKKLHYFECFAIPLSLMANSVDKQLFHGIPLKRHFKVFIQKPSSE